MPTKQIPYPSQERIRELFSYENGYLIRKKANNGRVKVGEKVYSVNNRGYSRVGIDRKSYVLHRIIYIYHHGAIPDLAYVDHINQDKSDNRIENLRLVTPRENNFNSTKVKGYSFCESTGKYRAGIRVEGKTKMLGSFDTAIEASLAYVKAKQKYHDINTYRG